MDLSKTFLDIINNKTCFLCFKDNLEMTKTTEILEIRGPYSTKSLSITEMVHYLFPAFDIISSQACNSCLDLLITMYITVNKNNMIQKLVASMTKHCDNVIDETTTDTQIKQIKLSLHSKCPKKKVRKHKNNVPLNCNLTNTESTNKSYKHKRKGKKTYNCDRCSYKSLCKGTLEGHINKYHIKTRPFTCRVCYKSFYTKHNLTEHQLSHEKNGDVCEICGVQFTRKQSLLNHLKLHSNDRAYKCNVCDKSFINSGRRLEHMKRSHLEKNECCMFCDKKFGMKKELMRHVTAVHA